MFIINCCFCGEIVKPIDKDPSILSIKTNFEGKGRKEEEYNSYCHLLCFKKKLSQEAADNLYVE